MANWIGLNITMRWILVAALVACSAINVQAADSMVEEARSLVDVSEATPGVTVSAVLMPAPVIEVLRQEDGLAKLTSTRKPRLAKKKPSPTMMLTRTERHQVALLSAPAKAGNLPGLIFNPPEDYEGGFDELVLHRSFNRPRVVDVPDDDDADALAV